MRDQRRVPLVGTHNGITAATTNIRRLNGYPLRVPATESSQTTNMHLMQRVPLVGTHDAIIADDGSAAISTWTATRACPYTMHICDCTMYNAITMPTRLPIGQHKNLRVALRGLADLATSIIAANPSTAVPPATRRRGSATHSPEPPSQRVICCAPGSPPREPAPRLSRCTGRLGSRADDPDPQAALQVGLRLAIGGRPRLC